MDAHLSTPAAGAARAYCSQLGRDAVRMLHAAGRLSKRGLLLCLRALEATLLDRASRERIHASATFALIFAFAVTSVDFLITGGPEFGPSAARAQTATYVAPRPAVRAQAPPTELAPELAEATGATITPTRQSLAMPLSEPAILRPALQRSPIGDAALLTISDLADEAEPKPEPERTGAAPRAPKKD